MLSDPLSKAGVLWVLVGVVLVLGSSTVLPVGGLAAAPVPALSAPAPSVSSAVAVTASASPLEQDAGLPVAFSAWASGCGLVSCGFAWAWADGTGGGSAEYANHSFQSPGVYQVTCWANATLSGAKGSTTLTVTVVSPPTVTVAGAPAIADVGEKVLLVAQTSGGVAPLNYTWTLAGGGQAWSRDVNTSFTTTGSFTEKLLLRDAQGALAHDWWNWSVNPAPSATGGVTPSPLWAGEVANFTCTSSGGTAPLSYAWAFGDGTRGSGAITTHAFLWAGTYHVAAWANDSDHVASSWRISVTVQPSLAAVPLVSQNPALAGQQLNFIGQAGGGVAPYTYAWTFGDGNIATSRNATHAYGATGTYAVSFWVNDSAGHSAHGGLLLIVDAPLTASLSSNRTATDIGYGLAFQATPHGGSGAYTYSWTFSDGTWATGASVTHVFALAGIYPTGVWVNDSAGGSAVATETVLVSPRPILRAGPSSSSTDVGVSDVFDSWTSGGTGSVNVTWTFPDGTHVALPLAEMTFTAPGSETVNVWANDSLGASARLAVPFQVDPGPHASPSNGRGQGVAGLPSRFWGNFTGGSGPFSFLWAWGDGTWSSSQGGNHTYLSAGLYTVRFWVNDSVGGSSNGSVSMTILAAPAPSPGGSGGLAALWPYLLLLVGVAAGALLAGWYVRSRRPGGPSLSAPAGTTAPGSPGAAFLPREEADFTGEGKDLPPWPTAPLTVYEGIDRELLYKTAMRHEVDPSTCLVLSVMDAGEVRTKFALAGATVWQVSRLDGEQRISPLEIDRIAHYAESHLSATSGRVVLVDATDAFLSATGLRTTARFLHMLHEVAEQHRGTVLVYVNPRDTTLEERRSLEEGSERVRIGPKAVTPA